MKCYGVYHVFCVNNWRDVFLEQLDSIKKSEIYNVISKFFLSVIYETEDDLNFIRNNMDGLNFEIKFKTTKNEFEFPSLKIIKNLCDNEDCYIFYIHTKGVSITKNNMSFYHGSNDFEHISNCVKDWREYMTYFIIHKHKECLDKLKEYDACGVNLVDNPSKHFSGNFWWSKSDYIKKLPNIENINLNSRWSAEFWIGMVSGNFFSFHKNNAGYTERLNKQTYQI